MYDPALPEEGVQGWELAQFLPEDEELFTFDEPEEKIPRLSTRYESPLESALKDHYRTVLARNRQKLLTAQKHIVRSRVALHEAYAHKVKQLVAPLPPLSEKEFLVTATSNGPSVHTLAGERQPISWGHIMTGHEWGIEYVLDPSTFSYDERHTYLNRLYKHRVALLDTEHELLDLLVDAYKDESPEMAEAVKTYRDRYRALFDIETGSRRDTSALAAARTLKTVRAFLTSLTYDFPTLNLETRCTHPIEDVGYGIQLIISRKDRPGELARICLSDLSKDLQAINGAAIVERSSVKTHVDPATLNSSSWKEKLGRFEHAKAPLLSLHVNAEHISKAFDAWYAETDLLEHALYTPDKQLPRDFWALIIKDVLDDLLSAEERQTIISTI